MTYVVLFKSPIYRNASTVIYYVPTGGMAPAALEVMRLIQIGTRTPLHNLVVLYKYFEILRP